MEKQLYNILNVKANALKHQQNRSRNRNILNKNKKKKQKTIKIDVPRAQYGENNIAQNGSYRKYGRTQPVQDDSLNFGKYNALSNSQMNTTPSVAAFAGVYSDPFRIEGARLPVYPIVSSQLIRTFAGGKGVLNDQGNGYVVIRPISGVTNDDYVGLYTNSGSATDDVGFATGMSPITTNSEYNVDDFQLAASNSNRAVRLVALGVRVRYLGTVLNAAGTVYTLQMSPSAPSDSVDGFNPTIIKQYPGFKEYTFRDDKWHSLTRHIQYTEDFKFQGHNNDLATGYWNYMSNGEGLDAPRSFDSNYNMLIYMSATKNQPFEFEVVGHYEIIGPNMTRRGVAWPSTQHVEQVVSAYTKVRHSDTSTPDHSVGKPEFSWMNILKKGAETVLPLIPKLLTMLI